MNNILFINWMIENYPNEIVIVLLILGLIVLGYINEFLTIF